MAEIHPPPKEPEETSASSGFLLSAFNRLKRRLRGMAREISGNSDDADDALQEAFTRLWERRKAIRSEDEASALMTTTVRNLSVDAYRRQATHAEVEIDAECKDFHDSEAERQATIDERFLEVQALMSKVLTPSQIQVMRMRDYEDRSYEEIACLLQLSETAVHMQLSRARKAVREAYRQQHSFHPQNYFES